MASRFVHLEMRLIGNFREDQIKYLVEEDLPEELYSGVRFPRNSRSDNFVGHMESASVDEITKEIYVIANIRVPYGFCVNAQAAEDRVESAVKKIFGNSCDRPLVDIDGC